MNTLLDLFAKLKQIESIFEIKFGVSDVISNSKIFEVVIADVLDHELIPGHSGSRDTKDFRGEYEYKHFKESSSNHSWTFNDFSDSTIDKLGNTAFVIFAHIDDIDYPPKLDWYYDVPGKTVSDYLRSSTPNIRNTRKMINISPKQLEEKLGFRRKNTSFKKGRYSDLLKEIFKIVLNIEKLSGTKNILTSNKLWEVLVASKLGHRVNSEQGGRKGAHDAQDKDGSKYEYKISINKSWNFQDISPNVLKKYLMDKSIILAVVDKKKFDVSEIYKASPNRVVQRLREKLDEKKKRFKSKGGLRRLQVSLSAGDLAQIGGSLIT